MDFVEYLKQDDRLKEGDTVRLKSGGPELSVVHVGENAGYIYADVIWFTAGNLDNARINVKALEKEED